MSRRFERIIRTPVLLDYAAYDVLHSGECGADAPKPAGLEGLSPGSTYRERVLLIKDVLADLRERGLAKVDNPVPELRETIRLLHNPHRRIYGWYGFVEDEQQVRGSFHLAESDDVAVLAVWERGQVLLEPVRADDLHSVVASLLPDAAEPVAEEEIVVPAERPPRRSRDEDAESALDEPEDRVERDPVQRRYDRVEQLTSGGQHFVMQLGKARRGAWGEEKVSEFPLNYYFGPEGAVLSVLKRPSEDPEGEPLRHLVPATPAAFRQELRSLS
ncbi:MULTISPECIES: ESX secretion-associated protein EspG [unclassified Actinopolyspora]|uniref:ESX secretion-associated protein EspG n=1 Tax=Actinopolyspora TaxID=1849 RepID=UPI0013F6123E|nr:ESX secretion-associated protein EspG [Actinopolyspora sp. BKK2]NHE77685.1 ESX secretion-associated protein EspG [Actinopolyspora sp. BKK1]